ncbi:hypothetical protein [Lederbergia galactosidilytica]|uniref:Copper resistance protein D domain-containing protein n=1 Tax=Lederbergia galactosidilytica TaxID=217031 RepID=A0A0Q9XZW5_9BACI|nr:hypothetical protein [Lederbergia galactosidilytica]KRG12261.1 hypothetical protein ACA30_19445 [Virgibacillus soli]KRG13065.1 hypothetical protein ACA29_09515 [Lederbergia galactosidilytica]MBP1913937.1 putative copper export protein [Lederbergia galactosidilytica]OAK73975.1 hypothetical protein ABB05_06015 [Lederbergia galactosidilytica]
MFKFWLFLHFTGLSIWLGSLLAIILILVMMKKHLGSKELSAIVKKITRIGNILVHPSAFFVLLSGVLMIISMNLNAKPFYLAFMERVGGITVLITIIGVSLFGRKLVKKLTQLEVDGEVLKHTRSINNYIMMMLLSILLVLAVIFVVSFRF